MFNGPLAAPDFRSKKIKRRRQAFFKLIAIILFGLTRLASAGDVSALCEIPTSPDIPLEAVIYQALAREPDCSKSEIFLFSLGQKLNQARQYSEAIDRLEAAMMLSPKHWAAHLEYAIALEGMGDTASVDGILHNLLKEEEIDAPLKHQIKAQLEKRRTLLGPNAEYRTTLSMVAGYDDNLMGSARVSSFDLTLPIGRLPVTLSEEEQPKAGRFVRLSFEHEGFIREGQDKKWSYNISANYRLSPDYSPANFGLAQLLLERGNSTHTGIYTNGGILQLQTPSGTLLRHYKLGAGYDAWEAGTPCRLRLGTEFEHRSHPNASTLDGQYVGGLMYGACPKFGFQAQLRYGRDTPNHDLRAGGTQNQYTLRLSKNTTLGSGNLITELEFYRQDDQAGYSPILENNLKRSINRNLYRIEYRTQLSDLGPYIGVEHINQEANLSLFSVSNTVIYVGIRSTW